MSSQLHLLPSLLHYSPFLALGLVGGHPSGPPERRAARPRSLKTYLEVIAQEGGARAAYLLRPEGPGRYSPWISIGEAVPSVSLPEIAVPMQMPVPIGKAEHPATLLPLGSASFGPLLLLLVHERRPQRRAQELRQFAERASFLFTLVENDLLRHQSQSVTESLSLLSSLSLQEDQNEETLARMLEDVLWQLAGQGARLRGRFWNGKIEGVSQSENAAFPPAEEVWRLLADRTVLPTPTFLAVSVTLGERTFFWAFATDVAELIATPAERLVRTAAETYRRHRSEAGIREAVARIAALYALEHEFSGDTDPSRILSRTVEELARAASAPMIGLVTLQDGRFDLLSQVGLNPARAAELLGEEEVRAFVEQAAAKEEPETLFLPELPEAVRKRAERRHVATVLVIPVHLGGEAAGLACLAFQEECVLDDALLEHLSALAAVGMQAYSRQRLALERQEILQSYRSLSALTDVTLSHLPLDELLVSLSDRLYDVLVPDGVAVFLVEAPKDGILKPVCGKGSLAHLPEEDIFLTVDAAEVLLFSGIAVFEPREAAPLAFRHVYSRVVASAVRSRGHLTGVIRLDFPLGRRLREPELNLLRVASERLAYVVEMRHLIQSYEDLYVSSIMSLAGAVDAKDPYIRDHSEQVSKYARVIAEAMNLPPKEVEEIATAALLHDVGKIAIPDAILNKPDRLTPEEYEIVKTHADHGARIVEQGPALRHLGAIIRYHHERPDGKGYHRMSDQSAPLGAYVVAVADAFDTMTTDRPYRAALTLDAAMAELKAKRGTQFLPSVVDTFTHLLETGRVPLRPGQR